MSLEKSVHNNFVSLQKLLRKNRYTHNVSSEYYNTLYQRYSIPTIMITSLTALGGFLNSSDIVPSVYKEAINITIGVLGVISTSIQTLLTTTDYGTKKKMFENAADAYDKLLTELELGYNGIVYKEEYEIFKEKMEMYEKEIIKITNNCKYLPPLFIIKKWIKEKHLYGKEEYLENITTCHEEEDESEKTHLLQNDIKNATV